MIQINHSSIVNAAGGVILHGVNCMGVMGAGVALDIKQKWPESFEQYKKVCDKAGSFDDLMGTIDVFRKDDLIIVSCFTQKRYGKTAFASYDAIESCLNHVVSRVLLTGHEVHFPAIGCGHGKLNWRVVEQIIENCIPDTYPKTLWIK